MKGRAQQVRSAPPDSGLRGPRTERFKITGLSKVHSTCDRCGKTGLDETIVLKHYTGKVDQWGDEEVLDVHYGSDCAGRAVRASAEAVRAAAARKDAAARARIQAYRAAQIAALGVPARVVERPALRIDAQRGEPANESTPPPRACCARFMASSI